MKKFAILISFIVILSSCKDEILSELTNCDSAIWPDYTNITIPYNIAPLNFDYIREYSANNVTTFSTASGKTTKFKGGKIRWNVKDWKKLMDEARGGEIEVKSTDPDLTWKIYVSDDAIDYGVQYRLVAPGFQVAGQMGLYERNLSNFTERCILQTKTDFEGCLNCHEYKKCNPSYMQLHIRGLKGATFVRKGGADMIVMNTKTDSTISGCAFPYWHPSGEYIAYSTNITKQHFFIDREKPIEAYDNDSDLLVMDLKNNTIVTNSAVQDGEYLETMPSISPDGKTIYFARASKNDDILDRKYNICKVSFDPESGEIGGTVETVFDAISMGKSASMPRPSYDGKYLMFSIAGSSFMHIFDPSADLWIMNLESGESKPASEANSNYSDSFHNWSTNSRWFIFESKRMDGLVTHAYISHIDDNGTISKPFILPQKNPMQYYSRQFMSYNTPCFISEPLKFSRVQARRSIESDNRTELKFRRCDR